jgi:hypothetical protein
MNPIPDLDGYFADTLGGIYGPRRRLRLDERGCVVIRGVSHFVGDLVLAAHSPRPANQVAYVRDGDLRNFALNNLYWGPTVREYALRVPPGVTARNVITETQKGDFTRRGRLASLIESPAHARVYNIAVNILSAIKRPNHPQHRRYRHCTIHSEWMADKVSMLAYLLSLPGVMNPAYRLHLTDPVGPFAPGNLYFGDRCYVPGTNSERVCRATGNQDQ